MGDSPSEANRKARYEQDLHKAFALHNQRIIVWSTRSLVFLLVGPVLAGFSEIYGFAINPDTVIIVTLSVLVILLLASVTDTAKNTSAFFDVLRSANRDVTWRMAYKGLLEKPLQPMMIADLMVSTVLLLAIAATRLVTEGRFLDSVLVSLPPAIWLAWVVFNPQKPGLAPDGRRGWLHGRAFHGILILFLLSNLLTSSLPVLDAALGTVARVGLSLVMAAGLILSMVVIFLFLEDIYDALLRILPCRGRVRTMSPGMRRVIAALEALNFGEMIVMAAGTLVLSPLVFRLHDIFDGPAVFVAFNLIVAAPVLLSALLSLGQLRVGMLFYIQRLGILYVIVAILLINTMMIATYNLTWLATQAYLSVFGPMGRYFFPDFIYIYRDARPADLPFDDMSRFSTHETDRGIL